MKRSSKFESKEHAEFLTLIQQFKNLEKQWKSLQKKSKPKNPRTCSGIDLTSFDHLLTNSPRKLMSSLQKKSPSHRFFRAKARNLAVEEILRDRRAAIMTGKLKGRRLFTAEEESGMCHGGVYGWLSGAIQEREVLVDNEEVGIGFDQSCSFSDTFPGEEEAVVEEKRGVAVERDRDGRLSGGQLWMVPMAWFGIVFFLISICIILMNCNQRNEMIRVPT